MTANRWITKLLSPLRKEEPIAPPTFVLSLHTPTKATPAPPVVPSSGGRVSPVLSDYLKKKILNGELPPLTVPDVFRVSCMVLEIVRVDDEGSWCDLWLADNEGNLLVRISAAAFPLPRGVGARLTINGFDDAFTLKIIM